MQGASSAADLAVEPPAEEAALVADARALEAALDAADDDLPARVADVVARARRARDPEALAWGLRAQAVLRRRANDPAGAVRLLDEARTVAARAQRPVLEAWMLASRSVAELERGRTTRARADAEAALALAEGAAAGDRDEARALHARVQLQLAVMEHNAGRLVEAEARYRAFLREVPGGSPDAVRGANNLAVLLVARADFDEALRWAERAVAAAAGLSPLLRSWPYLTRALVHVQAGRLSAGLRDLELAAGASEAAGQSSAEYYVEYADAMREMRLLPEAAAAGERALAELATAGAGLVEVDAEISLAETLLVAGDAERAARHADRARARARAQRRPGVHDRAVVVAAEARLRASAVGPADLAAARRAARRLQSSGELAAAAGAALVSGRIAASLGLDGPALAALRSAADLGRRGSLPVRMRARLAAALVARHVGADATVLSECRAGLRDLARHRAALPTMELRALASGHGAELGELGLDVVVRQGSAARVLRWMEQTRAAALLARLPVDDGDRAVAPDPEGDGPAGRTVDDPSHERGPDGPRAARSVIVADEQRAAEARRSAWLRDVGADGPVAHRVPGLGDLRAALDGRVLVEYGRHDGRLVAVVVGARGARLVDVGPCEAEVAQQLRALVFALRRLVDPRGAAAAAAARTSADLRLAVLRRLLVAPLGVDPGDELVVVPVGLLHGVPWSALHDGPVGLAPSATAWARTRARTPDGRGGAVLVAGPGLRGAQEEVDVLRGMHPDAVVLGAGESTADGVVRAIARADLAHLACHGSLRADNPMFSAVVLADGPVTVQELHRAGVAPRRLVLASCHSGADVAYAGDEVLGLVSAVLARGTAGVVASIAAVPDVEVVDLMRGLHARLAAGETMARALHGARAEVDRDAPAGFVNWCTFGAHGAA
ncbi:CHAT domain-containing protein [Cellulomonas sp. JZ18]|uniref:CHAT domain-containing protein n=1 Tax=Cellulomonas sp. JZ18 TaxID=2654191 RepID=UPI0012D44E04|nr:CHAT domain-containing protein [Cellulomonas sp. JZ18]QGQ18643.1 CHAT domain-containing protein [Cellulomonas sp. JZ18]